MTGKLLTLPRAGGALAAASIVCGLAMVTPAYAATDFDGDWSVVIVTQKGDCDHAYRAPITIANGKFISVGVNMVDVSGKIAADGKITVHVSRGEKSAVGIGRLSAASGTGSWKGGTCAGTWTAERR